MKKLLPIISLLIILASFAPTQYSFDKGKLMNDLKFLSSDDLRGRDTGSEGNKMARQFILQQLQKIGAAPFVPTYIQSFPLNETTIGNNILAVIPGKKKEAIVVSAHYDHVGIRHDQIYNGADDNASGVAALLAIIKFVKKKAPSHRIIFAFFDAEEKGLKGSAHFVNSLDLTKENIVLNINLDMVSRSDKYTLYACGGYHYPHVKKILERVSTPKGITLGFGFDDPILKHNNWTSQSDQYNFHLKKIPFVYFGVENHADYHKPTDDFEKIDPVFYANSVETILQSLLAIDKYLQ